MPSLVLKKLRKYHITQLGIELEVKPGFLPPLQSPNLCFYYIRPVKKKEQSKDGGVAGSGQRCPVHHEVSTLVLCYSHTGLLYNLYHLGVY